MATYFDQGIYKAEITGQVLTESRAGNPELQLRIRPTHYKGQDGAFQEIGTEWERTVYLTFTEATVGTADRPGWVLETLRALGFDGTSFAALDPNLDGAVSFIGQEVTVSCQHDTFNGKEREKWGILRPRTPLDTKPLDKKGVRSLDTRFGKVLKALKGKPVAVTSQPAADEPPPPPTDGQPPAEEDIPF